VFLYAFDLLELDGQDMRSAPLEERRATLAKMLRPVKHGVHLSDHVEAEGPIVFRHACALSVEGVVSKRKGSLYRSGRTPDWVKCKNPASPAAKRDAEGSIGGGRPPRIIWDARISRG
jgi:bifunctional non-homologous end joining protein LigD